jgi:hypothetical protein
MAQVCEGRRVFCPYGFYSPALTRPRCRSPACPAVDCASRVLVCLELLDLTGRELALGVRLGPPVAIETGLIADWGIWVDGSGRRFR